MQRARKGQEAQGYINLTDQLTGYRDKMGDACRAVFEGT